MTGPTAILVTDTSVLVNYLRIDRMDLIGRLSIRFLVTDHAAGEILGDYPEQVDRFRRAVTANIVEVCRVADDDALELFARLTSTARLGVGESASIAYALSIGAALAIDDRRAAKEAKRIDGRIVILGTADIMCQLIREGLLTLAEADAILVDWATNHRFKLKVQSFAEIL
jgi:hypothetical protein